jgi:hypothetical protein
MSTKLLMLTWGLPVLLGPHGRSKRRPLALFVESPAAGVVLGLGQPRAGLGWRTAQVGDVGCCTLCLQSRPCGGAVLAFRLRMACRIRCLHSLAPLGCCRGTLLGYLESARLLGHPGHTRGGSVLAGAAAVPLCDAETRPRMSEGANGFGMPLQMGVYYGRAGGQ